MKDLPVKELIFSPLFQGIEEKELSAMLNCLSGSVKT